MGFARHEPRWVPPASANAGRRPRFPGLNATRTGLVDGCFSDSSQPDSHGTGNHLNATDRAAFAQIDSNDDGKLDFEELMEGFALLQVAADEACALTKGRAYVPIYICVCVCVCRR